jgi:hypothetical protein
MKNLILLLFYILMIIFLNSQTIEIETSAPFITSYTYFAIDCIFSYDDLVVYHPDWGIVLLEENENNELVELSRLYTDYFYSIVRCGDYLYFSNCDIDDYSCDENIQITKIDISDPGEPEICDVRQLDLTACSNILHVIEHYLFVMVPILNRYCRIDLDDFSIDGYYDYYGYITRSFGEYILGYNQDDQFIVYQNGSDSLEVAADNFDLFEAHNEQSIYNIHQLSGDTVCTVASQSLVLWNISELENWIELDYWEISDETCINESGHIARRDSIIYLNTMENVYKLEIDNENIEEIDLLELPHQLSPHTLGNTDNFLLIPDSEGIGMIDFENNQLLWEGYWGNNPIFNNYNIIGDNYFLISMSMFNYQGLYCFDISTPDEPVQSQMFLTDNNYYFMEVSDDLFYLYDFWNNNWDLYQYNNIDLDLIIQFPIEQENEVHNWILHDEYEDGSFYISKPMSNLLQKYNIIGNDVDLVLEENFPAQKCGFIQNGVAYFLQEEDEHQNLMIYTGLHEDEVELFNQYNNLVSGSYCFIRYLDQNYLLIQETLEDVTVFGYDGTELTGQAFSLSTNEAMNFIMYCNYLVCCDNYHLYFYEITDSCSGLIDPDQSLELCYSVNKMEIYHSDEGDFIFCFGHSAVSIVEISITNGVLNTEIVDNPFSIDAFPNPVYTSQNEKVNFQLSNQTRLNQNKGELSVFNIKGQLVHRQEIDFNRDNSLQWNCRLESGTKAASGVYLYRINTGKNSSVGKFIITK